MANIHHRTARENTPFKRSWLAIARNWRTGSLIQWQSGIPFVEDLAAVPESLLSGNPQRAREIYAGFFNFAGISVETDGTSPFEVEAPSALWEADLHRFLWLRDLQAADNPIARSNAESLVQDWIARTGKLQGGIPWQMDVVAERIISWLAHAPVIVGNVDQDTYSEFLQSIAAQARYLALLAKTGPTGMPVLKARIAIAFVSLSLSGQNQTNWKKTIEQAARALGQELDQQFFADGGHISRNPDAGPEALSLLLPLHNLYSQRSSEPPPQLIAMLDRVLPMLEFFNNPAGGNARFNGGGRMSSKLLDAISSASSHAGKPPDNAIHCGYQRLQAGQTCLIIDTGKAGAKAPTGQMHAGCLSFEMTSASSRFVVNCGTPQAHQAELAQAARSTAAHSTVTLNDKSSCRFAEGRNSRDLSGPAIISGINQISVERQSDDEGEQVCASHDGYLKRFALLHQRIVHLASDGNTISGSDRFLPSMGNGDNDTGPIPAAIRFHLHPDVEIISGKDVYNVQLTSKSGGQWKFTCIDARIDIEDSIYFEDKPRTSRQIVLTAAVSPASEIRWIFENQKPSIVDGQKTGGGKLQQPGDDLLDLMVKNPNGQ